ncbi:MAG TPA: hypothetical protein VHX65_02945 [Pirellulales bacterium]|jgi:hypothetical protein|nr:hypothetical protein [Pirellulales bacterium]
MPDNNDNHSKLRSSLFGAKPVTASPDEEISNFGLPDTSAPYQAFARPTNKPVYTLHCGLGKDGFRSFEFVHLDSNNSFKTSSSGQVITLRFAGTQVMQVTIKGRNLWQLYGALHSHLIPWIVRADRDLADEQEAIITAIEIVAVESSESKLEVS